MRGWAHVCSYVLDIHISFFSGFFFYTVWNFYLLSVFNYFSPTKGSQRGAKKANMDSQFEGLSHHGRKVLAVGG